jgi:two-component system cell cycle sensor histidine kinase/response regulator CckA
MSLRTGVGYTLAAAVTAITTVIIDQAYGHLGAVMVLLLLVPIALVAHSSYLAGKHRHRAEQSERRRSESFHKSPIPVAITNMKTGALTEVNEAFARLTGYSQTELVGRTAVELGLYGDDEQQAMGRLLGSAKMIRAYPLMARTRAGGIREMSLAMDLFTIDEQVFSLTTVIDRTEQSRTTAALARSDERLRELADAMDQAFWVSTLDYGEILYISPAYERIYGRTCDALHASPHDWMLAVHPDDRERMTRAPEPERLAQGSVDEFRIVRPNGEIRWVRNTAFAIRDDRGTAVRIAGTIADITERRALEEQLRQTQKMESLGMLAGGIAHDFNNVLAVIASCSGMLGDSIPHDSPDRELVDDIDGAVERASGMTRQLLAFSRKQVSAPVVIDLNATVNDTRKMLRRMVGEDVLLSTSLDPDLRRVRVDPSNMVQILMNLAVNARDAMARGGSLQIQTRNEGDQVVLSVTDTGAGMAPDVRDRIFEPFFTTKAIGKGTGMGLAVVHGILDQAGGRIQVQSSVGSGTTFQVFLPAIDGATTIVGEQPRVGHGVENILMVDDDDYVRRAAARGLRAHGYTVHEARDGQAALQLLGQRGAKIDLLLTDVVMPGMDGRALAEAARAKDPDLQVLYMSGYTDDAVLRYGVKQAEVDLIEKPFGIQALAGKVRQVLDRTGVERIARVHDRILTSIPMLNA